MKQGLFSHRTMVLSGVLSAVLSGVIAASPAAAAAQSTNTPCSGAQFSEPFASLGDTNSYMLAPGQSVDNFAGTGWTLTGGARIVSTRLADGSTGHVLDLPPGSKASSPWLCVRSNYEAARTMARQVSGSSALNFYVSYRGTSSASSPALTGHVSPGSSWGAPPAVPLTPATRPGEQHVQLTFSEAAGSGEAQIYNFYIDPRFRR
jgi:hypothetical protein